SKLFLNLLVRERSTLTQLRAGSVREKRQSRDTPRDTPRDKRRDTLTSHAERHAERHADKTAERHADKTAERHAERHADKPARTLCKYTLSYVCENTGLDLQQTQAERLGLGSIGGSC
ncbi:unnamed protein product, partial [Pleuronectes platessa]